MSNLKVSKRAMSQRTQENIVAIILFLIFVGFLVVSFDYGSRARMIPVPVAIASLFLILLQLILQNTNTKLDLNVNPADLFKSSQSGITIEDEKKETIGATDGKKRAGGSQWVALSWLVIILLLILLIGLIPAMCVFVLGYLLLITKLKWHVAACFAAINTIVLYVLFVLLLQREMYEGLLLTLLFR